MKEESKKIKLFKDILVLAVIAIVAVSAIFTKPISNLDEIWNFNFSRNVTDGLIPYKDFNIVQMPLLAIICGIVFKVFGTELIIMRCMAVILMCLIFFMSYKVLKKICRFINIYSSNKFYIICFCNFFVFIQKCYVH